MFSKDGVHSDRVLVISFLQMSFCAKAAIKHVNIAFTGRCGSFSTGSR